MTTEPLTEPLTESQTAPLTPPPPDIVEPFTFNNAKEYEKMCIKAISERIYWCYLNIHTLPKDNDPDLVQFKYFLRLASERMYDYLSIKEAQ